MPRVRYTGGSRYRRRGVGTLTGGDCADVGESTAERLTARHDFELVDTDDGEETDAAGGDAFDADAWLDRDYRERAERVTIGEADAHLDRIREIETSETVRDAVDGRQELIHE